MASPRSTPSKPPAATGWSFGVTSILSKLSASIGIKSSNGETNEPTEKRSNPEITATISTQKREASGAVQVDDDDDDDDSFHSFTDNTTGPIKMTTSTETNAESGLEEGDTSIHTATYPKCTDIDTSLLATSTVTEPTKSILTKTTESVVTILPVAMAPDAASLPIPVVGAGTAGTTPRSTVHKTKTHKIPNWADYEEEILIQAVKTYGEWGNWANVAAKLSGRSEASCRRKWPKLNEMVWTKEEDALLNRSFLACGQEDWEKVAKSLDERTSSQCSTRWAILVNVESRLSIKRPTWTHAEENSLVRAVNNCTEGDWVRIAALNPGRSANACQQKYIRMKPFLWGEEEDKLLGSAVQACDKGAWEQVAAMVPKRIAAECRSRWSEISGKHWRPKWTEEQVSKLIHAVKTCDPGDWVRVATMVPSRTSKGCSAKWLEMTRKEMRETGSNTTREIEAETASGEGSRDTVVLRLPTKSTSTRYRDTIAWTDEEETKLSDAVRMCTPEDWEAVATMVPGMNGMACRLKWINRMFSKIPIKKGQLAAKEVDDGKRPDNSGTARGSEAFVRWTVEEETRLVDAVISYGEGSWPAVTSLVSSRSELQCRKKWGQIAALVDNKQQHSEQTSESSKQYFDGKKPVNSGSAPGSEDFVAWTAEEETRMIDAVISYGEGNWPAVASLVSGRSWHQCRNRWKEIVASVANPQHQQSSVPVATTATAIPSFPSVHPDPYPVPVVFPTFQQYPTAMHSFPPMYHHQNIMYGSPALMGLQQGGPAGIALYQQGIEQSQLHYPSRPPGSVLGTVQIYNPGLVAFPTNPEAPYPGPDSVEERARKRQRVEQQPPQ
jgi:hypothetical protein